MPETVGDMLAATRRSRGKSLVEIEGATRIRVKLLEALEKGDYEKLPSPAYVRGYIISIAKFLDVNPGPLLAAYSEESGHRTSRDQMRLPQQVVPTRDRQHAIPWRTALLIAGVLAVIALAFWLIGKISNEPDELPPVPNVPEASQPSEPTITPGAVGTETVSTGSSASPTETTGETVSGEPFTLKVAVAAQGASWLRVTVDGLKAYEGTLAGGQSKEWEVLESATVRIGKPSAVTVTRDGETLEIPPATETPVLTITSSDPAPSE